MVEIIDHNGRKQVQISSRRAQTLFVWVKVIRWKKKLWKWITTTRERERERVRLSLFACDWLLSRSSLHGCHAHRMFCINKLQHALKMALGAPIRPNRCGDRHTAVCRNIRTLSMLSWTRVWLLIVFKTIAFPQMRRVWFPLMLHKYSSCRGWCRVSALKLAWRHIRA